MADAEQRLHKFVVILFSQHHHYSVFPFKRYYKHFFESDKTKDYHGRWINVVCDQKEVIDGRILTKGQVDVLWTQNHSMIFIAKEYVVHDAYNLRTLNKLDQPARKIFGDDLEKVRDIYFDD